MKNKSTTQERDRVLLYLKLMVWLLIASILGIFAISIAGHHPGWVGFLASLGYAELSRRVLSEQNPDKAMRWRDIWRFTFTGDLPKSKQLKDHDES